MANNKPLYPSRSVAPPDAPPARRSAVLDPTEAERRQTAIWLGWRNLSAGLKLGGAGVIGLIALVRGRSATASNTPT